MLYLAVCAGIGALFVWLDGVYLNLLGKVGGNLDNLPPQTQGALLLAHWVAGAWLALLVVALILALLYGATIAAPEGKRPKPGVVWLLWMPVLFAWIVLMWLIWAQRTPIEAVRHAIGGGTVAPDLIAPAEPIRPAQ